MQPIKEYAFDNFIVGKSNKFAYTASKAAADKPGEVYNPLFIYGNSGLGKTHLLNAIYNQAADLMPDATIILLSAEELSIRIVSSIKAEQNELRYADLLSADMVLIDDMHPLAGKKATQLEFVSLVKALVDRSRQVVMTCSAPPHELPWFESEFRMDFEKGLFADIQPLDSETAKSIIHYKAEKRNLHLSEETIDYMAYHVVREVRTIEGNLNCLRVKKEMKKVIEPSSFVEIARNRSAMQQSCRS